MASTFEILHSNIAETYDSFNTSTLDMSMEVPKKGMRQKAVFQRTF